VDIGHWLISVEALVDVVEKVNILSLFLIGMHNQLFL
jgi:hypothetical protein